MVLLEELYLDHNQLESLPDEIGALIQLRELDIVGNVLKTLPKSFTQLVNLEVFHGEGKTILRMFIFDIIVCRQSIGEITERIG